MNKVMFDNDDIRSKCVFVPCDLITASDMDSKRLLVYLYLAMKKGYDSSVTFSVNQIAEWCGYKPNRNKGKINSRICELLNEFENRGYFSKLNKLSHNVPYEHVLRESAFLPERYAILYFDEIYKLINYKDDRKAVTVYNLILVFAYLRLKILKRDTLTCGDSHTDTGLTPETYYCFYSTIATALRIDKHTVSNCVDALRDLKLIYFEKMNVGCTNDFVYTTTIFANYYKRYKKWLAYGYYKIEQIYGEEYYKSEISNVRKLLKANKKHMKGEISGTGD